MVVGQLEIQLLANMARLQKDMDDAKRVVGGAMANIESAVSSAKTVLGSLGAGLSLVAFTSMVRGSIDAMDKLNDLSKTTKIAVGELAGLKLAAKQSGGDLDSIAASINKLSVTMGKDPDKFAKLGVDAKSPLEAFKQLSNVFSAIEDPQLRAAFGAEALGKSWAGAAPLLSEGGKKIGEMVDKGKALAGVTQEMADRADEFNDKLAELGTATDGAKMKLAGEMLPAMIDITKAITEAYVESGKLTAAWVALGALGAFAFTDEFASNTVKMGKFKDKLKELEGEREMAEKAPAVGIVGRWLFGSSDLNGDIAKAKAQINTLQSEIDRPAREAAAKAADKAGAIANAAEVKAMEEKAKQFLKGKEEQDKALAKSIALAKAETSLYTSSLQQLEQQLGKANDQTQVQKTQYQLVSGSLQTLSAAHGKHLLQIAREIDLKAQWAAVSKAALDYAKELTAEQDRANEVLASFNTTNSEYLQQLEFETGLLGLSAGARERVTAERKLEMDYQRAQIALSGKEIDLLRLKEQYELQKDKLPAAVAGKVSAEGIFANQEEAKKKLDAFFDPTKAQTFGDALKGAFGGAADAAGRLSSVVEAYGIKQAEIDKARTAATVAYANDAGKLAQAQQAINEKEFATRIGGYADMAGAAKGFFAEGSNGYKTLDGVSKAFHVAQMAMNAIEMGQKAIAAVLNQAGGDPYTAFPRMAAMAAAVGALGFAVGGGFSGGGGDAVSSADRQKAQGTGTVLGDSEAKSESLLNALEAMQDNTFTQLKYSSGMLDALKSIQRSMAGLAQIIFRTNGLTSGNAFGVKEGTFKRENANPLLDAIGAPKLEDLLLGKITTKISDSGLGINGSLGDLTQGRGFSQYADVETTKRSWFGLVKNVSSSTQSRALEQSAADQLASVFAGISTSLQIATVGFGRDADTIAAQLAASVISIPAISLRGLKGQELQDALNAVFSAAADKLAHTVAPGFESLQKAGEGYYETVIRASTALATANGWMGRLKQNLFGVSTAGAIAATKLAELFGGINELNAASQQFYNDYFSEAERAAQSTKDMTQALATVNLALPGSKEELRALAGTLDLNTEAGRKAYAVLLTIAPEFAATADLTAKAAKDTATKLLATFTGNGQLLPALDVASLNTLRLKDSLTSTYTVAGAISTLFLDLNSGLITFGSTTTTLTGGLTGAQLAGGMLTGQIEALRQSADKSRIDFAGLGAALNGVSTTTFVATMGLVFDSLAARIKGTIDAIGNERIAVREAALQIVNPGLRSRREIAGDIAGSHIDSPSNARVTSAVSALREAQSGQNYLQGVVDNFAKGVEYWTAKNLAMASENSALNVGWYSQNLKLWGSYLATANTFLGAAVTEAREAQLSYASALQNFTIDASKSVSRLSRLREETMKYYEAQKQLADLMGNSAAGLRTTVANYRYSQLTDAQQFDKLQGDFAKNYALALSTDGTTLASYGDKLNAGLNPLLEKAKAVLGNDAYLAFAETALARADAIAARLETLTPKDYAADSLAMLGQIDATLAALDQSSRSAEKIISDAVKAGADQTSNGLRALGLAITGKAIPAFAAGGSFMGGLRIVGENGPELEATGPSRIFNANQTRDMLRGGGGGGSNAELVAELRALRAEVAELRNEARDTAVNTKKSYDLADRTSVQGQLMRTQPNMPLSVVTVAAA